MACNLVTFSNRENHEKVSFVIFAQDPKGRDYFGITLGLLSIQMLLPFKVFLW